MAKEVPLAAAEEAAEGALLYFIEPDFADVSSDYRALWGASNLRSANLRREQKQVQEIYDLSGVLLFRDFVSTTSNGLELRTRTAATSSLSSPVVSLGINQPLDLDARIKVAREHSAREGLQPVEGSQGVVCYSYPKLGLLCRGDKTRRVIDLFDLTILEVDSSLEENRTELLSVNSLLSATAGLPTNDDKFDASLRELSVAGINSESGIKALRESAETQVLTGMTLIGQDNDHFCAAATAKMILAFHGIEKSQAEIARAMNTGEDGALSENQRPAYGILSNNALEATLETSLKFDELKQNILNKLPCKLGTLAHARAIDGYQVARGSSGSVDQQIHICDPYPPQIGQIYWENLEDTKQRIFLNFIFVHKVSPSP